MTREEELLDALQAVREALGTPDAATAGDQEIRDRILVERAGHAVVMLGSVLDPDRAGHPDIAWSVAYLRARLAGNEPPRFRTFEEAMADMRRSQDAAAGR